MIKIILLALLIPAILHAKEPERYYQQIWCKAMGGQMEVVLPDRTRVDCLTDKYAVEVDFAPKWAEAVGQSLHYAGMTGKQPGILLVLTQPKDDRYLKRLQSIAADHGIRIWTMKAGG